MQRFNAEAGIEHHQIGPEAPRHLEEILDGACDPAHLELRRLTGQELQESLGEDWLAVADDEVNGGLAALSRSRIQQSGACSPVTL